jgi:hypothetical protein
MRSCLSTALTHPRRKNFCVVRVDKKKVVGALSSKKEIVLDLHRPDSFDVGRSREIIRATKYLSANDKRLGLTNGQVLTVSSIAPDGALQAKEGLCVCRQNFGNGTMATSLHRTRPKGGEQIT